MGEKSKSGQKLHEFKRILKNTQAKKQTHRHTLKKFGRVKEIWARQKFLGPSKNLGSSKISGIFLRPQDDAHAPARLRSEKLK